MIKKLAKSLIPPIGLDVWRRFTQRSAAPKHGLFLHGLFSMWSEAAEKAAGYRDSALIERVAARNVMESKVAERQHHGLSDRDAQIFSAILIAVANLELTRPVEVLDFGGEMGGVFRALARLLKKRLLCWTVLETTEMATRATAAFRRDDLNFTSDDTVLTKGFDIVLASGSLHCVDDPTTMFRRFINTNASYMILNILPLVRSLDRDFATVRIVRSDTYEESYPLWLFSENVWRRRLEEEFRIVMEWSVAKTDYLKSGEAVCYQGFLLERKQGRKGAAPMNPIS
jgi:putative methyltransferase (TIGR04325 family)